MHIIPASQEVKDFLGTISRGREISLEGRLVNGRGLDRSGWSTSLTRGDTGDGACEVFYVENATPIDRTTSHERKRIARDASPA